MNKIIFSAVLSVVLISSTAMANGICGGENDGTSLEKACQISDCYELQAISEHISEGLYYIQTANVNCSEIDYDGNGFMPIGNSTYNFTGFYDGNGFNITDLYIGYREGMTGNGLFGYVGSGSTINNVSIISANVSGFSVAGVLAGYSNGNITSSITHGTISSVSVGGLVGENHGYIDSSSSGVRVVGGYSEGTYAGGLVGQNYGEITHSTASGYVTAETDVAGGLVGNNAGNISSSYSTGNVSGNRDVGGFVGLNGFIGYTDGYVTNSYSTGNATGTYDVGGFVGRSIQGVYTSYSTGSANCIGEVSDYCGGFVGRNGDYSIGSPIYSSFSMGNVTGNASLGNFAGYNSEGSTFDNCWCVANGDMPAIKYDENVDSEIFIEDDAGAFTNYNHYMYTMGEYDWDFDVWFKIKEEYPVLSMPEQSSVGCGDFLYSNMTLSGDLDCSEYYYVDAVSIEADNLVFDCNGHNITGDGQSSGIAVYNRNNVTIKNCNVGSFSTGIAFIYTQNSSVMNSTSYGNAELGVQISFSSFNNFSAVTVFDNYEGGYYISGSNNVISNGEIYGNALSDGAGISIYAGDEPSSNNIIQGTNLHDNHYTSIYLYNVESEMVGNKIIGNSITNTLNNDDEESYAIYSSSDSSTRIEGNNISISNKGIYMYGSYDSEVLNNTLQNISYPLYFYYVEDGNVVLRNTIIGDEWVYQEGDYAPAFNDTTSGNKYLLSDGTHAYEIYNLTDADGDNWTDYGDIPFSSAMSGVFLSNLSLYPNTMSNDGSWSEIELIYDEDLSTGASTDSHAEIYYAFNLAKNTIEIQLHMATDLGIEDSYIPSECVLFENWWEEPVTNGIVTLNFSLSSDGNLDVFCYSSGHPYGTSTQEAILSLVGVTTFNGSMMNITTSQVPWTGLGEDWHPYTATYVEPGGDDNVSDNTDTIQGTTPSSDSSTYYSDSMFSEDGNLFIMSSSDRIIFPVNNTNHTLTLLQHNSTDAKVRIESEPIVAWLKKDVTYRFDVDGDSKDDVTVRYDGNVSYSASMFIQEIQRGIDVIDGTVTVEVSGEAETGGALRILMASVLLSAVIVAFRRR